MSDHTETWDDVIEQVEKETFVGRAQELAQFSQEIAKAKPGKLIFYISGQGGVGKTKLLERFQEIARDQQFLVVESDEQQKDIPTILGHFARQLTPAGQKMEPFAERYALYRQLRQEIENDVEAPQGLAGALARTSVQLVWGLLDEIPMARQVTKLAPDAMREGAATQASEWANYLSRKLKNKDDVALMRDPVAELSPLFFQALNKLAQKHKLLLCFDNYEYSRSYLDSWLTRLRDHRPSRNIHLALAGRDLPGPMWDGLKSVLSHIPLEVFTPEEAEAFLDLRGIENPQRRQEILEFSDRLPVLMDWLAAPEGDGPDPQMPTTDIVERFLRWERDPALRQTMLNLAVPYTFNQDLVALLLDKESPADVEAEFDWLCGLPSTQQRENGWQYHDVVRRRLLHYLRQKSPRTYAGLHNRLATFYQAQRENLGLTLENQWANARWQAYTVEYFYHHFCSAPDAHWGDTLDFLLITLHHQDELFRLCLARLNQPVTYDELSLSQSELLASFLSINSLSDAEGLFVLLCQNSQLSDKARSITFAYLAETYQEMENYSEALTHFHQAIELDNSLAWAIARRGLTYGLIGNYEAALLDFDQAIALGEKETWTIKHRGILHFLQMNFEAALADFDQVILQDKTDADAIARRGNTHRQMGNYAAALADFDRAVLMNPEDLRAIAFRGMTHKQMGNYAAAITDFDTAIDGNYIWAVAKRGETYLLMHDFLAALADFNRAIALGQQDAWTISSRGLTNKFLGNYESALSDYNQAIELGEEDGWIIASRGDLNKLMGNYELAIEDFNRAVELDEKDGGTIANRGQTQLLMGNAQAALTDLTKAIEIEGTGFRYYIRSLAHRSQSQYEEADSDLEQAISFAEYRYQKKPHNWHNTFDLALYYLVARRTSEAEQLYRMGADAPAYALNEACRVLNELLIVLPGHEQAVAMRAYLAQVLEERERGKEGRR